MDSKLTLKLDSDVIEKAKSYAKDRNVSLSELVERYLDFLTTPPKDDFQVTPLVKSLSGIIVLPESYNPKTEYRQHLNKKYANEG
ncbi:hypothetical protein GCM10010967_07750 [Dyadobacter beijingensis]|uniref:Uncharacterized protein n=1 Tax=Dyadobacter beijingensis TaxID=365489 RepID=A0ABQ2HEC0_9BACT|nr:DUF6364 family protein [Dyadobacter beijingensis]GGM78499.1 hypothetical protein GCM10010967_07750 [Dyadobacter beijingensis]